MSGNVKSVHITKRGSSISKTDDPEQSKRFLEAAKEAQTDGTEEGADKAYKKRFASKHKETLRD